MTRLWYTAAVVATYALAATPAAAQVVRAPKPVPVVRADSAAANDLNAAAAVILTTEPNSIRVIAIPIPPELRAKHARYVFVRQSQFNVQGHLEGDISPDSLQGPIVLNVSVPITAPAGRLPVGVMRFTCDEGCDAVEVSVLLDVQSRSSLQVEPTRELLGTHAGAHVKTDVSVRNSGNAPEQVTISLQLPNDWRSRILLPQPMHLLAGASVTVPVEIIVSDDAGMGDYGVQIEVATEGGSTARAGLTVRVGAGQKGAIGWRPMLEANVGVARDADGNTAAAYGADLTGEIFPGVHANGRASFVYDANSIPALTQQSLGRLGYSSGRNSFLTLNGPSWEVGGGMLGLSNAGLAGTGLWGAGGSAHVNIDSTWRGSVFGVEPDVGGHYFVGDGAHLVGPAWAGFLLSDLHDNGAVARDAQVVAGTFELPWKDGTLSLQAGRRSSDTTSGLAWQTHLSKRASDWSVNMFAAHTPAGAAAFSQGENQFQLDGYRKLNSRYAINAGIWSNRDAGAGGGADMTSSGWTFSPQVALGKLGAFVLETRGSTSNGSGIVGNFGNKDSEVGLSWFGEVKTVQTRFGLTRSTLERTSSIDDLGADSKATSYSLFASASATSPIGLWQFDVSGQRAGVGVGVPSRQLTTAARLDQVPLIHGRMFLRADLLMYYLGATNSFLTSEVLGLDIHLSDSYKMTIDAERTGQPIGAAGSASWVISTRIKHGIGLPALRGAALHGVVYADLNGNGKRDRNERGMAGAVVIVDGEAVTTDDQGRFAVGRLGSTDIEVDPRSLPMGWMAGPRPMTETKSSNIELSVVPTSPVQVTIRFASTEGIDTAAVHFEKAIVVLTDTAGRQWTGAADTHGVMRFDALPPGAYEVSADLSTVGETLVLPTELPMVRVEGVGAMLKIDLKVSPRRIRLTPPGGKKQVGGVVPPIPPKPPSDHAP